MRGVYYRYNAETDNFERIYPTIWGRLRSVFMLILGCGIVSLVVYVLCYRSFGTPTERQLREENLKLQREYGILKLRVEQAVQVLRKIEDRDRKLYRILLQNDSIVYRPIFVSYQSKVRRNELQDINVPSIVTLFNNEVELLEKRLYEQIQSFEELTEQLRNLDDKVAYIPSILPLERRYAEVIGTFGVKSELNPSSTKSHEGVDFIAPVGVPVYATAQGKVTKIDKGEDGFNITVQHGSDYTSFYSHLGEVVVKQEQDITKGEVIGFIGELEKSFTSSYLHYEVRYKNQPENPLNYFYLDFTPEEYEDYLRKAEEAVRVID